MIALITGASRGLGLELVRQLLTQNHRVFAGCRQPPAASALTALQMNHPDNLTVIPLDVTQESSISSAQTMVARHTSQLGLLLNVAGILHDLEGLQPERKLASVTQNNLLKSFMVNAFGPILVAKHFESLLLASKRPMIASVSARIGSISDNRLGGWYAYRASKAAQNQLTKTLSIEMKRKARTSIVVGLHPGTVDTDLSKPFQRGVAPEKLFTVERAAEQLIELLHRLTPEDTGRLFAYDGTVIPW